MATLALIAVRSMRTALVIATAITLLLPMPARCASCATGSDSCAKCAHVADSPRDSDGTNPVRPCCQRHSATDSPQNSSAATASIHHGPHTCGCGLSQSPRTTPPVEKLSAAPEFSAALATVAGTPSSQTCGYATVRDLTLAAPPPIPHRILHCSWII